MNRYLTRSASLAALAALLTMAVPANAADYLFKGDCERAQAMRDSQPIHTLLKSSGYRGVLISRAPDEDCGRDELAALTLDLRSGSADTMTFAVNRETIFYGSALNPPAGCSNLERNEEGKGIDTMRFTMMLERRSDVCELYIDARWIVSADGMDMTLIGRAVPVSGYSFTMSTTHFTDDEGTHAIGDRNVRMSPISFMSLTERP